MMYPSEKCQPLTNVSRILHSASNCYVNVYFKSGGNLYKLLLANDKYADEEEISLFEGFGYDSIVKTSRYLKEYVPTTKPSTAFVSNDTNISII